VDGRVPTGVAGRAASLGTRAEARGRRVDVLRVDESGATMAQRSCARGIRPSRGFDQARRRGTATPARRPSSGGYPGAVSPWQLRPGRRTRRPARTGRSGTEGSRHGRGGTDPARLDRPGGRRPRRQRAGAPTVGGAVGIREVRQYGLARCLRPYRRRHSLALRGDIDGAIRELTVARELGRDFGNVGAEMESHVFEADLHLASGRRDKARELLESACAFVELRPFYEGNAYCLEEVAAYAAGGGNTTDAARLLGLAQALRDVLGTRSWALLKPLTERIHDAVRSASHGSSFDAAYAEGRTLDPRCGAALCRTALALPVAPPGNVAAERT
jgi:hypothetical protein